MKIVSSEGENIVQMQIEDGGIDWIFQFGIEGDNVGLFSVVIAKYDLEDLNMLGALAAALSRLEPRKKLTRHVGSSL